jgi:hypothetical protein
MHGEIEDRTCVTKKRHAGSVTYLNPNGALNFGAHTTDIFSS